MKGLFNAIGWGLFGMGSILVVLTLIERLHSGFVDTQTDRLVLGMTFVLMAAVILGTTEGGGDGNGGMPA